MPTIGSETRTIRFSPSDLGKIEAVMKKEETNFNNAVHLLISRNKASTEKNTTKTDYESICEMANLMRVTPDALLGAINRELEEGTLYYSDGRLINARYEEFESVCESRNLDIDKTLEKVVREIGK